MQTGGNAAWTTLVCAVCQLVNRADERKFCLDDTCMCCLSVGHSCKGAQILPGRHLHVLSVSWSFVQTGANVAWTTLVCVVCQLVNRGDGRKCCLDDTCMCGLSAGESWRRAQMLPGRHLYVWSVSW